MASVSVTGLHPLLTTARWRWLECYHLSGHAISMTSVQRVLDQPLCSMLVYYIARPDSQFLCRHVYFFFCDHTYIYCPLNIYQCFDQQIQLTLAPNMPCMLLVIGVSLSKPHTSVTLLHVLVYVCLLGPTTLEILNQRISLARALLKFKFKL